MGCGARMPSRRYPRSVASLVTRRGPWVLIVVVVAVGAVLAVTSLPLGGSALAFRIAGPIEVTWEEFSRTGGNITVTLCNTSEMEVSELEANLQGIEFTRPGSATTSPGVIVTHPRTLGADKCTEIGLKKAPELQPGAYRGTLEVKGAGGTIRRDFRLAAPRVTAG